MKIGVIGLGLIGGSLAKAIMLTENHSVYGTDINETVISKAMLVGAIDGRLSKEECSDCDMLILALFPSSTLEVLSEYAPYIKKGAVVLDTCGVKRSVCDAAVDCEGYLLSGAMVTITLIHPLRILLRLGVWLLCGQPSCAQTTGDHAARHFRCPQCRCLDC